MRIALSDTDLKKQPFPDDVQVLHVGIKDLSRYGNDPSVVAIAGSRAMAIEAAKLAFPGLKLFQLTSAGFDGVPTETYKDKGVAVANAGSVYSAPIAETVILSLLLMAKRLHKNPNNRHSKIRRRYDATITEIVGKRILILGTGSIATAVARRLQGFEATVDGYNRSGLDKPEFAKILSGRQALLDHIGEYDYVISTLPDTDETRGMIDGALLGRMSRDAVIVNVGRRAVFKEDDLFQALKNRQINGAVLDMFEKLPNPLTNRFRRLSNVIVLPGVSAVSREVKERLREQITRNILAVVNGDAVSNVINGVE